MRSRPRRGQQRGKTAAQNRDRRESPSSAAEAPADRGDRPGVWLGVLLLLGAGMLAYANSVDGPFIYDDNPSLVPHDHIRQLRPLSRALGAPPYSPVAGRPVVSLSLAVNYSLGKMNVRGYHALNIAVHIACAALLFGIVRRTLLCEALRSRFGHVSTSISLVSALLWLVHPLQTECVNYVTQRTESMMSLFYLLTLYCAIRAHDSDRRNAWYVGSVMACALGMAAKESMVTAPLMVLLYGRVFVFGSFTQAVGRRRALYGGLAATWIILAALMWSGPRADTVGLSLGVSPWDYAKSQCWVIVHYLRLAVWPDHLLLDYGFPEPVPLGAVAPYAVVLVALLILTIVGLWYHPKIGFLGAWFFITLGPTSSFVPITTEVGAERRVYLPLAGLVILAVTTGYVVLERAFWGARTRKPPAADAVKGGLERWVGGVLVVVMAAVLIVRTVVRNEDYRSGVSIWRSVVDLRPDNWRARNSLGEELRKEGRIDEALAQLRVAVDLRPDDPLAQVNLGRVLQSKGEHTEALAHFRAAVDAEPEHVLARMRLASALAGQGDAEGAVEQYLQALRLQPGYALAHCNLGILLAGQNRLDEAIDHYRQALQSEPAYAEAHYNLGTALGRQKQLDEAIKHFRLALQAKPDYADAYYNLAMALNEAGQTAEALRTYQEAVRLKPELGRQAPSPADGVRP